MIVRETGTDMSLFDDMTVFVRAVEAKSFSGAAQRLGLAKSVVSRRMASLEGRLGTRLFHRHHIRLRRIGFGITRIAIQHLGARADDHDMRASPDPIVAGFFLGGIGIRVARAAVASEHVHESDLVRRLAYVMNFFPRVTYLTFLGRSLEYSADRGRMPLSRSA
jgi:Bacterial regulatory helix-turn-helix protein, lysR family